MLVGYGGLSSFYMVILHMDPLSPVVITRRKFEFPPHPLSNYFVDVSIVVEARSH